MTDPNTETGPNVEPEPQLERYVDGGVVEDIDGYLRLTDEASATIRRERDAIDSLDDEAAIDRVAAVDRSVANRLAAAPTVHRGVAAEFLALRSFPLDEEAVSSLLVALDYFGDDPPRDAGVPDAFVPIHGDRLVALAPFFERAVVYVWREDCPPCETVRADLDECFPERPDDVALLATFGPRDAALLQEAWDVVGGPTTLFLRSGRPESRLIGAATRASLEHEIRLLRK